MREGRQNIRIWMASMLASVRKTSTQNDASFIRLASSVVRGVIAGVQGLMPR